MTVWIVWDPEYDAEVRAAYNAMNIGEAIQQSPEVSDDGRYMVGSSVLTLDQANGIPHVTVHTTRPADFIVTAD